MVLVLGRSAGVSELGPGEATTLKRGPEASAANSGWKHPGSCVAGLIRRPRYGYEWPLFARDNLGSRLASRRARLSAC